MIKIANTKYPVNELIKKRWSPRSFSDQKISKDTVLSLFEAASWAASSRNEQPWKFIFGLKDEGGNYQKIYNTLVLWNQKWAKSAPLLVIGVSKVNSDYHNQPNEYAHYDLGQAVATLSFQALSENIYLHQMGGFDKDKARHTFNISPDYEPVVAIAIGYPGKPDALPDDMRELEEKGRSRFDLDRIIFDGEFKP